MAKIVWTSESLSWLEDIYNYISQDSISAAKKVVDGIYQRVQTLVAFPLIGYLYQTKNNHEIRILLYGHYRIAYLIKNDTIYILGIYHGALEMKKYFKIKLTIKE